MNFNKTIKFIICAFLSSSFLYAKTCENGFDIASEYFLIEKDILKGISDTETGLNQFAVLIKSNEKKRIRLFLKKEGIKHKYDDNYLNVYPASKEQAAIVYHQVLKSGKFDIVDYDLGLMQVNQYNLKRYEVNEEEYYLDCIKNIFLGADILRKCFDRFQNPKDTIECYHRGTSHERIKKSNYTYFSKFYRNYTSLRSE